MTAQAGEKLIYNGQEYHLATEPLNPYLEKNKIKFVAPSTACWRGYYGSWLIESNKLYLTNLIAYAQIQTNERTRFNGVEVGLEYLFPNQDKVFAEWFSGTLRIPYGKMIYYQYSGYDSIYEKEILLKIESGKLIYSDEIDNTHSINPERLKTVFECLDYLHSNPKAMKALSEVFWRNASVYSSSLGAEVSIFNRIPKKLFFTYEFLSNANTWKAFKKVWYKELSSNYSESWIPLADFQTGNDELFVDVSTDRLPVIVAKYMGRNDFRHKEICDSLSGFINNARTYIYVSSETKTYQDNANDKKVQNDLYNYSSEEDMNNISNKQEKSWFRKIVDKLRKFC